MRFFFRCLQDVVIQPSRAMPCPIEGSLTIVPFSLVASSLPPSLRSLSRRLLCTAFPPSRTPLEELLGKLKRLLSALSSARSLYATATERHALTRMAKC
eukprot:6192904-Pleurochrysis_carterae.AAC.1